MERMGHASPAIALRYQHVMADRQAVIASALDQLASSVGVSDSAVGARTGHAEDREGDQLKVAGR